MPKSSEKKLEQKNKMKSAQIKLKIIETINVKLQIADDAHKRNISIVNTLNSKKTDQTITTNFYIFNAKKALINSDIIINILKKFIDLKNSINKKPSQLTVKESNQINLYNINDLVKCDLNYIKTHLRIACDNLDALSLEGLQAAIDADILCQDFIKQSSHQT